MFCLRDQCSMHELLSDQSDVKRYKVAEAQNGSNHHYEDDAGINEKRRRLEEPLKEEPRWLYLY